MREGREDEVTRGTREGTRKYCNVMRRKAGRRRRRRRRSVRRHAGIKHAATYNVKTLSHQPLPCIPASPLPQLCLNLALWSQLCTPVSTLQPYLNPAPLPQSCILTSTLYNFTSILLQPFLKHALLPQPSTVLPQSYCSPSSALSQFYLNPYSTSALPQPYFSLAPTLPQSYLNPASTWPQPCLNLTSTLSN
ncbi:hypothetical protein E2C01_020019 [Portunus trituberculatus]|uniref:Uncharacterized protein n=1 Tax=Portunus trituberculatus TaxID=210409 RepID=A0A5B7DZF9_PORTR|nr:hypothetical protein [Portunus trituberculatus]